MSTNGAQTVSSRAQPAVVCLKSGTGVPPVDHAQDARATINPPPLAQALSLPQKPPYLSHWPIFSVPNVPMPFSRNAKTNRFSLRRPTLKVKSCAVTAQHFQV